MTMTKYYMNTHMNAPDQLGHAIPSGRRAGSDWVARHRPATAVGPVLAAPPRAS